MSNETLKKYYNQSANLYSQSGIIFECYDVYTEYHGNGKTTIRDWDECCDGDPKECCGGFICMAIAGACISASGC